MLSALIAEVMSLFKVLMDKSLTAIAIMTIQHTISMTVFINTISIIIYLQ